jgi:hypothetical protein
MSVLVNTKFDFGNARRITNLAPGQASGEPVTYEQLNAAIEAIAWKDNARVASQVNVTVSSPGASIDGVSLTSGDRVLLRAQTSVPENGIYIWNGAAVAMTRAADASTFDELESAVVMVDEGTSAGAAFRQTQVNGTISTNNIIWTSFGAGASAASETASGVAEIATQAETDAGADDARFVTPLKLATYAGRARRYAATIGDNSATSIAVTHNLGTLDVQVYVYEVGGLKREVFVEKQHTSTNQVTLVFDTAPTSASMRVVVIA